MPDLDFQVEKAEPVPHSATPLLAFKLCVASADSTPIRSVALRCQVRIEPARRRYGAPEQDRLRDLFGTPQQWSRSLRSMLWTHTSVVVPPFTGSTVVDLPVPCSFDFTVAATKYFHGLEDGDVPLSLLFSGTIFYEANDGRLQVAQIPWEKETTYRLPLRTWQGLMDLYYPNSVWLCLRKDVFDQLYRYKSRRGLPTWEQALENLLASMEPEVPA